MNSIDTIDKFSLLQIGIKWTLDGLQFVRDLCKSTILCSEMNPTKNKFCVFVVKTHLRLHTYLPYLKANIYSTHNPSSQTASKLPPYPHITTYPHIPASHTTHQCTHTNTLGLSPIPYLSLLLCFFPWHSAAEPITKNCSVGLGSN